MWLVAVIILSIEIPWLDTNNLQWMENGQHEWNGRGNRKGCLLKKSCFIQSHGQFHDLIQQSNWERNGKEGGQHMMSKWMGGGNRKGCFLKKKLVHTKKWRQIMYGVKNILPQTAALNRTEWPFTYSPLQEELFLLASTKQLWSHTPLQ